MLIYNRFQTLLAYAIVTGSYFLLGLAGLKLAIPPGYSSVVFPAAGLAFIVVLMGGIRFLPSIWLGSFLLNVWVASQSSTLGLTTLSVAGLLGIGASLQALAAAYLIQNTAKINWKELATTRDIVLFLALSGPLASLVSATWGSMSLFLFGIINSEDLFANWMNWWLGDITGVITIAPLLLVILFSREQPWAKRKTHALLPITIAFITAILLFSYMSKIEHNEMKAKLAELGENIADNLSARVLLYQEALASISTLRQTRPKLSFEEFKAFSAPILQRYPELKAIELNAYVTSINRKLFESQIDERFNKLGLTIKEENASGEIVTAQNRKWYMPISFIMPVEGNEAAIAYDSASNPLRLAAINKAMKTHDVVITAPIRLVQEVGSSAGLLMINPLLDQNNGAIDGLAVAVIRIESTMASLLANKVARGLNITIKDTDEKLDNVILYASDNKQPTSTSPFIWTKELGINHRLWQLSIIPSLEYTNKFASYLPWQVLVLALWLITFLQVLLLSITGQHYLSSQKIKEQNIALELMAHYDTLTGLPNRTLFSDRYKQAISLIKRNKSLLAIGFLDLDNFKPVNDTYGHDIGDKLLISVAQRIQMVLREHDTVCRNGGDEFALLIGGLNSQEECTGILSRLLHELAKPYFIETNTIEISGSCGVVLYLHDDENLDTLLRHADQAMYQAKLSGRNQFKIFNSSE